MLVMHSPNAYSFKFLCVLLTLFPGVLLFYFPNFESDVVRECEEISFLREAEVDRYTREVEGVNFEYLIPDWELEELEIAKYQRPFECITNRIHGRGIGSPEYQNLKLCCELRQTFVRCDPTYPYRTINGTCNNLRNVKWGSSETCVKRIAPTTYEGAFGFRRSVCGKALPNPRVLSLKIFKTTKEKLSKELNTIFVAFAQQVSHDMVATPDSAGVPIRDKCCSRHRHPQCSNIYLPPDDPFYSKHNVTCLTFLRAAPCGTCSQGKRNTMVRPTSFIDVSFVYGLTDREAANLRKNDGTGKMWVQETNEGDLLPPDLKSGNRCGSAKNHEYCFIAGDERVNQHASLTNFQTIFAREHNRIAGILKQLNPHWSGEKLYQESRKIVIAELQVIVYKELLPLLLGPKYMSSYGLAISDGWSAYNPSVDPTIYAEFIFAAYRLHSLIPSVITKLGADGGKKKLQEFVADSAAPLYHGEIENMLHGMCSSSAGIMDTSTTHQITDSLLISANDPGIDLLAVDIHRGRDAGLSPYVDIIKYLWNGWSNVTNIRTFEDLKKIFQPQDVELLKSVYCHVRDIDYFVGMHFEPPTDYTIWGSTAEIVARQFRNVKFGDRFFFEHFGNFNKDQLRALKKVTLSSIICDNTNLKSIQRNAMKLKSAKNPEQSCKDIPKLDLELWKTDCMDNL